MRDERLTAFLTSRLMLVRVQLCALNSVGGRRIGDALRSERRCRGFDSLTPCHKYSCAPVVQRIEYDATNVGTVVRLHPGVPSSLLLDNKMLYK